MSKRGEKHWPEDERARIILEATTAGDANTCRAHKLNIQTLRRWRRELKRGEAPGLAESVRNKRRALDEAWAEKVPGCLTKCVTFIDEAASQSSRTDPDVIHAIAGAMKLVAEVAMSWKAIDARISGQGNPAGAASGQVPAGSNVTPIRRPA